MHKITIYFVGGSSVILEECNDKCAEALVKWLDNGSKETFKIDIPSSNRTKCFRKELILFVDVD